MYIASWLGNNFKFMVFRLLKNAFASQKIESRHFNSCPLGKTLPKVLIITPFPRWKGITHPPMQRLFKNLFPSLAETGRGNYDSLDYLTFGNV